MSCFLSPTQRLLHTVTVDYLPPLCLDKEAAERLSKTVDEACLLLAEYNGRLAAELEDRRQLARMLIEYTQNQKDVLTEKEKKLEVSSVPPIDAEQRPFLDVSVPQVSPGFWGCFNPQAQ